MRTHHPGVTPYFAPLTHYLRRSGDRHGLKKPPAFFLRQRLRGQMEYSVAGLSSSIPVKKEFSTPEWASSSRSFWMGDYLPIA